MLPTVQFINDGVGRHALPHSPGGNSTSRAGSPQAKPIPMIAKAFGIALRTEKMHRQRAMEKVGAAEIEDLVRIADEGIL